jgi:hypothetical protein
VLNSYGSSFLVSPYGIIATAAHVVQQSLDDDQMARRAFLSGNCDKEQIVKYSQLAVLHHIKISNQSTQVNVLPIENIHIAYPTDLAFGFIKFQESFPTMSFTLSPSAPRIGENIISIGYCDTKFPESGIPIDAIKDGTFRWDRDFSHRFHAVEGKVNALFLTNFAKSYGDGPCFLTDSDIKHGQSGGPVFNSSGNVCGVNLGGSSTMTNSQSSIASLIYPILPIRLKLSFSPTKSFKVNAYHDFISLIERGIINTDGSERLAKIIHENEKIRIDAMIHIEDAGFSFENFKEYLAGNSVSKIKDHRKL